MPQISIITASYNYEEYIKETIESVINQTFQDWEMIIVDDGSKDRSVEIIKSYCEKDSRIKLYQHENNENRGLPETLKYGISKSVGKWLIFLESDDSIMPDYIEKKLQITEKNPEIKLIFNDVNIFGNTTITEKCEQNYNNKIRSKLRKFSFPCNLLQEFACMNIIPTFSCVMLKKDVFKNDIKWNSVIPAWIDWYLWAQIAHLGNFYYIDEKLTNWRMHSDSYIYHKNREENEQYFLGIQIKEIIDGKKSIKSLANLLKFKIKVFRRHVIRFKLFGQLPHSLIVFGRTIYKKEE